MAKVDFEARILFYDGLILEIEVWVWEMLPDKQSERPGAEWVHEHLKELGFEYYAEHFKVPGAGEPPQQLLLAGNLRGWQEPRSGEFDEEMTPTRFDLAPLAAHHHELIEEESEPLEDGPNDDDSRGCETDPPAEQSD